MLKINMTVEENLKKIINELKNAGGIETLAVAGRDGLLLYSTIDRKQHAEKFAAMSATLIGVAETMATMFGKSIPDTVIVESKHGKVMGTGAGPKALLMVITGPYAGTGLILNEMAKASEKIKQVLG